jgi:hypothetical protein
MTQRLTIQGSRSTVADFRKFFEESPLRAVALARDAARGNGKHLGTLLRGVAGGPEVVAVLGSNEPDALKERKLWDLARAYSQVLTFLGQLAQNPAVDGWAPETEETRRQVAAHQDASSDKLGWSIK